MGASSVADGLSTACKVIPRAGPPWHRDNRAGGSVASAFGGPRLRGLMSAQGSSLRPQLFPYPSSVDVLVMAVLFVLELVILTGLVVCVWLRPQRHRTWVERRVNRRWRRWRHQRVSGPSEEPLHEIRALDQLEMIPPEPSPASKFDERQPAAAGPLRDCGLTDPHELDSLTGTQPCVLGVGWPLGTHLPAPRSSVPLARPPISGLTTGGPQSEHLVAVEGAQDARLAS